MHLKSWTKEAVEQLSIAEILNNAGLSSGERLALIICDNAIEFMMIAYVEMEKHLVPRQIKKKDWENIKQSYAKLLDLIVRHEPNLKPHRDEVLSYHNIRNTLYHTGQPVSVKAATVTRFLRKARDIISVLLKANFDDETWSKHIAEANSTLIGHTKKKIKTLVSCEKIDGAIKIPLPHQMKNLETICLILDYFSKEYGFPPTREVLETSLRLSGATHLTGDNLNKRIHDARRKNLIKKKELALTNQGRKKLHKIIIFPDD